MNIWKIPAWLEQEVRARDKNCVYCGVEMIQKMPRRGPRKTAVTWEHIINDARIITRANIALCCAACNSSKGAKLLGDWLQAPYCVTYGVTQETVAQIVKDALQQVANPATLNTTLQTVTGVGSIPSELQLDLTLSSD